MIDLVRLSNLLDTKLGVKRMLSREAVTEVLRIGEGGKMRLSCVNVEEKNSLNKLASASQSSI